MMKFVTAIYMYIFIIYYLMYSTRRNITKWLDDC